MNTRSSLPPAFQAGMADHAGLVLCAGSRCSTDSGRSSARSFYDPALEAPIAFQDGFGLPVPMGVKNINFLLKQDAPAQEIVVNGTVIADLNGNGQFDGDDTQAGGVTVYFDANRNNNLDPGEQTTVTSEDPLTRGQYSITIPAAIKSTYSIGVARPSTAWKFTNPLDGTLDIFAGPGETVNNNNFFLDPPDEAFPPGGANEPGNIFGVVYNDRNNNGFSAIWVRKESPASACSSTPTKTGSSTLARPNRPRPATAPSFSPMWRPASSASTSKKEAPGKLKSPLVRLPRGSTGPGRHPPKCAVRTH